MCACREAQGAQGVAAWAHYGATVEQVPYEFFHRSTEQSLYSVRSGPLARRSIIKQSYDARERKMDDSLPSHLAHGNLNGDGCPSLLSLQLIMVAPVSKSGSLLAACASGQYADTLLSVPGLASGGSPAMTGTAQPPRRLTPRPACSPPSRLPGAQSLMVDHRCRWKTQPCLLLSATQPSADLLGSV